MKVLRQTLFLAVIFVGCSFAVSAQKNDGKKPPPKEKPPVVVVKPKGGQKPKDENKPRNDDRNNDGRKRPQGENSGLVNLVNIISG